MPVKDRHDYTQALLDTIVKGDGACERIFVFDNGSEVPAKSALRTIPEVLVIPTPGASISEMWNLGLDLAASHSRMEDVEWNDYHNVAILNNDIVIEGDFLTRMATALRCHDSLGLVYPDHHGICGPTEVSVTRGQGPADRTMSGWAFMLRGELGLRIDEQFRFWATDDDLEQQVRAAGYEVAAVGGIECKHLEPNVAVERSPELQAICVEDSRRFRVKYGLETA